MFAPSTTTSPYGLGDDRRAFAVTLTDAARRRLPVLDEPILALADEVTAPLSARECDTLRTMLQSIAAEVGLIPGVHPRLESG